MSDFLHAASNLLGRAAHLLDDAGDEPGPVTLHKIRGAMRQVRWLITMHTATVAKAAGAPRSETAGVVFMAPGLIAREAVGSSGYGRPPAAPSSVLESPVSCGNQDTAGISTLPRQTGAERGMHMDTFIRSAVSWLLHRANIPETGPVDFSDLHGMTLLDLARESLRRAGVITAGMDSQRLIGVALTHRGAQGTSDFTVLLEDTLRKSLQTAYALAPDTWRRFCRVGRVDDFRTHGRYRLGSFGNLDAIAENGEFKRKAIPDGEKGTIAVGTKGNIIAVTRQALVNDDLGALVALTTALGRAAKRSVEYDVYALLALNAGLGPSQSDGQPLFHSNRANVGAGVALSVAGLDADRVLMASQRDPSGNDYLDLQPAVLVVPVSLGGTARVLVNAQYDPDTATSMQKPNAVNGIVRDIVDTPRVAGTRRYLFADPAIAPVLEVVFLGGNEEPVLETKDPWTIDGVEMRVRFDYGVGAIDWRGAVTNAGAA